MIVCAIAAAPGVSDHDLLFSSQAQEQEPSAEQGRDFISQAEGAGGVGNLGGKAVGREGDIISQAEGMCVGGKGKVDARGGGRALWWAGRGEQGIWEQRQNGSGQRRHFISQAGAVQGGRISGWERGVWKQIGGGQVKGRHLPAEQGCVCV